jgi:biopolymer transport protein ExbD
LTFGEGGGTDLGIIITPMLDMAFQLLAFFIMTYHPPAREAIVDDTLLPAVQQKKGKGEAKPEKEPQKKKEPETKFSLQVMIRAVPKNKPKTEPLAVGQPKELVLFKPGQLEPGWRVELKQKGATPADPPADFEAALKSLVAELGKSRVSPAEKDLPLDISADRALKYLYVARVRDVVAPLGFKRIGLNEPP